jgi:hypothetical protein
MSITKLVDWTTANRSRIPSKYHMREMMPP